MFSLPKKEKLFLQGNVGVEGESRCMLAEQHGLEPGSPPESKNVHFLPPHPFPSPIPSSKRQLLKIQWIKVFLLTGVQIRMLGIKSSKTKTITALPTSKHFHTHFQRNKKIPYFWTIRRTKNPYIFSKLDFAPYRSTSNRCYVVHRAQKSVTMFSYDFGERWSCTGKSVV